MGITEWYPYLQSIFPIVHKNKVEIALQHPFLSPCFFFFGFYFVSINNDTDKVIYFNNIILIWTDIYALFKPSQVTPDIHWIVCQSSFSFVLLIIDLYSI